VNSVRVSHYPNRSIGFRSARRQFIPDAGHEGPHLAECHLTAPLQATIPLHRSGLQHARACLLGLLLTSAQRSGRIAPPSVLLDSQQISQGRTQNVPCVDAGFIKYTPCEWRTSPSRARSSRVHHTSYPVPVRRRARSDRASFRPCLATTPLLFSSPSAPRTPGVRTFTSLVLCHARHTHLN
jgi:hypothetical protein